MDIDIIDEKDNPMLHRSDVRFELNHEEATPSRLSVRDSLAATLNKDATEVVVRKLDTKFGMRKTIGTAKVYESPGDALDIEQDHMLERNKISTDGEDVAAVDETEDEPEAQTDAPDAEAEETTDGDETDEAAEDDAAEEGDEAADEAETDGEE